MRILYLSYENYIDTQNDHDVMYLNIGRINDANYYWQQAIRDFNPELVLEREYNDGRAIYDMVYDLIDSDLPNCKKAVWLIDTHVSYTRHTKYSERFDYVFMAISTYADEFKKSYDHAREANPNGKYPKVFWLPVCFPYPINDIKKNYRPVVNEIIFVGNIDSIKTWFPERAEYIEFLKDKYGRRFHAVTDYENMRTLIREAKVSFNYCIRDDLNFRVFESLGFGTELVTNFVTDLDKIKGLKERVNVYHDKKELVRAIDSILNNETYLNTIEIQNWVKENHTLYHRYKLLLKMVMSGHQERF